MMKIQKNTLSCLAPLLLCASFAASAAVAPKAGRWSLDVQMGQDVPQIDPDLLKEFGFGDVQVPNTAEPRHYEICLTPEQIKRDAFPELSDETTGCIAKNLRRTGDRVDGDLKCDGWLQGGGRVQISLVDAQHYTGQAAFQGNSQEGIPLAMTGALSGQWLSADCGSVKPY